MPYSRQVVFLYKLRFYVGICSRNWSQSSFIFAARGAAVVQRSLRQRVFLEMSVLSVSFTFHLRCYLWVSLRVCDRPALLGQTFNLQCFLLMGSREDPDGGGGLCDFLCCAAWHKMLPSVGNWVKATLRFRLCLLCSRRNRELRLKTNTPSPSSAATTAFTDGDYASWHRYRVRHPSTRHVKRSAQRSGDAPSRDVTGCADYSALGKIRLISLIKLCQLTIPAIPVNKEIINSKILSGNVLFCPNWKLSDIS